MRTLVAWRGGLFLTDGKIVVLSVPSLFLTRVGVWVCVCECVYAHTHAHTAHMGCSDVSPGVGMRHLEGPKNPDGLNLDIHWGISEVHPTSHQVATIIKHMSIMCPSKTSFWEGIQ